MISSTFFCFKLFLLLSSLSLAILAFSQTSEWDGESEREAKVPNSLSLNHRAAISG